MTSAENDVTGTTSFDHLEQQQQFERGASRAVPIVYGARPDASMRLQVGEDETERQIGVAPEAREVIVREGRESLPSLERRDSRRRVATLIAYPVVVVACVAGLAWVATLVLG